MTGRTLSEGEQKYEENRQESSLKKLGAGSWKYEESEQETSLGRLRAGSYETAFDALYDLRVALGFPPLSLISQGHSEKIRNAVLLIGVGDHILFPPNVENCSPARHIQAIDDADISLAALQTPENIHNYTERIRFINEVLGYAGRRLFSNAYKYIVQTVPPLSVLVGLGVAQVVPPELAGRAVRESGSNPIVIKSGAWWKEGRPSVVINTESLEKLLSQLSGMGISTISMGEVTILETTEPRNLNKLTANIKGSLELAPLSVEFYKFIEAFRRLSEIGSVNEMTRLLKLEGYHYAIVEAVRECWGLPPRSLDTIPADQLEKAYTKGWLGGVVVDRTIPDITASIEKPKDALVPEIEQAIEKFAAVVQELADSYEEDQDPYILAMKALGRRQ